MAKTLELNTWVDKACYIEGQVVKCKNIGNEFHLTIDGFPVESNGGLGPYVLYDSVFNDMPGGWDEVNAYRNYEENILTPWLRSMGFVSVRWYDGERDSFGPLTRCCRMLRNRQYFEFIYG